MLQPDNLAVSTLGHRAPALRSTGPKGEVGEAREGGGEQGDDGDGDPGSVWVQRKVTVECPGLDSEGKLRGGVADMVRLAMREVGQYDKGIARLKVG